MTNNGKTVGIVQNAGNVTVNYRDASGSQVYVTIGSVAGWVPANAISNLRSTSSGSINVANLPTSGGTAGSTGGTASGVNMYDKAKSAVSKDNNIYVRSTATSSTKGATKLRNMRGKTFTVLGTDSTGSFLYVDYNGTRGFVRAQDFTFTSGNVVEQKPNNNTGTNGGNVTSNNTGMAAIGTPAGKGTGSSSEKWGSITIPGAGTYPIYGNYIGEKKGKTYYYYDYVLRRELLLRTHHHGPGLSGSGGNGPQQPQEGRHLKFLLPQPAPHPERHTGQVQLRKVQGELLRLRKEHFRKLGGQQQLGGSGLLRGTQEQGV